MEKYTCIKRCSLGGKKFFVGDDIPCELVDPGRLPALKKMGIIAVHEVAQDTGNDDKKPLAPVTPTENGEADAKDKPDAEPAAKEPKAQKPGKKVAK